MSIGFSILCPSITTKTKSFFLLCHYFARGKGPSKTNQPRNTKRMAAPGSAVAGDLTDLEEYFPHWSWLFASVPPAPDNFEL
jgi:hypothetical protein